MPGKPISFFSTNDETGEGRWGEEKRESLQKWTDEAKRRRDEGGNEVDEERQPDFPRKYQADLSIAARKQGGIKSP